MFARPRYVNRKGTVYSSSNPIPIDALDPVHGAPGQGTSGGEYQDYNHISQNMYDWLIKLQANFPIYEPVMNAAGEIVTIADGDIVMAYVTGLPQASGPVFDEIIIEGAVVPYAHWDKCTFYAPFEGAHGSADYVDLSANQQVITKVGDPRITLARGRFGRGSLESAAGQGLVLTGSYPLALFSSTGGWLNDFTIEGFTRPNEFNFGQEPVLVRLEPSSSTNGFAILELRITEAGYLGGRMMSAGNSAVVSAEDNISMGMQFNLNKFNHWVVSKVGSNYYFFLNGKLRVGGVVTIPGQLASPSYVRIGARYQDFVLNIASIRGYLNHHRVHAGIGLYTEEFVVPTGPFPTL